MSSKKKRSFFGKQRTKQAIFYWCILALPLAQIAIFYVGSVVNTILLSFQSYNILTNKFTYVGFDAYKQFFIDLQNTHYIKMSLRNSAILFGIRFCTYFVSLFSSYYLYKKMPFSGLAKVVFILPAMLGSLIMTIIFKYYTEKVMPALWELLTHEKIPGLLGNPDTIYSTLIYFAIVGGLTSGFLINLGTMNSISDSIVEAAKIDGAGYFSEFFYITLPMIYKLVIIQIAALIPTFFTYEWNLFELFASSADYHIFTFGYYMYRTLALADAVKYPYLSAMGVCMTIVAFTVTMVVRKLMVKFGPSED